MRNRKIHFRGRGASQGNYRLRNSRHKGRDNSAAVLRDPILLAPVEPQRFPRIFRRRGLRRIPCGFSRRGCPMVRLFHKTARRASGGAAAGDGFQRGGAFRRPERLGGGSRPRSRQRSAAVQVVCGGVRNVGKGRGRMRAARCRNGPSRVRFRRKFRGLGTGRRGRLVHFLPAQRRQRPHRVMRRPCHARRHSREKFPENSRKGSVEAGRRQNRMARHCGRPGRKARRRKILGH